MAYIQSNGINIYYEMKGTGTPLILISGLGGDHHFWGASVEILAVHFRVIRFDTRGIGKTDAPVTPYSMDLFTEDLHGLMTELNIPKAHLLGFSMGGNIAASFTIKYPERVDRLIIAASHAKMNRQVRMFVDAVLQVYEKGISTKEMFELICPWLFSHSFIEPPENAAYFYFDEHEPDQQPLYAWKNQYLAQRDYNVTASISSITHRTLILHGEQDLFASRDDAMFMHEQIKNSVLKLFPSSGHLINFENPEMFHREVSGFLLESDIL